MAVKAGNVSPLVGVGDTSFENSRLFSNTAHIDGLAIGAADDISVSSSATLPVLTRTGNGIWTLNRTAAAAETLFFRITLDQLIRTGEFQQFGGFGADKQAFDTITKGITIQDAFAIFQVGVVALTSATLRIGRTVYSATVAPVQTDLVAATALGSLAVSNPATTLMQKISVPLANQIFEVNDLGLVEAELAVVMANTGTLALASLGMHVGFNYD